MAVQQNPEGGGGFAFPVFGTLLGEKEKQTQNRERVKKGHFSRTVLGHMLKALFLGGRRGTGRG